MFIGVSAPNILNADLVRQMAEKSMILALANPNPEIYPEEAKKGGAFVTGTGRSDFANQVNNSLAFPGIFRAIQANRITQITDEMCLAAAKGIAALIPDSKLTPDYIIPDCLNVEVTDSVAKSVAEVAHNQNMIRQPIKLGDLSLRNPQELEY